MASCAELSVAVPTGTESVALGNIDTDVSSDQALYSTANLSTGRWYWLAFSYDGSSMLRIFVDGVQVATKSYSGGTFSCGYCFGTGNIE